MKYKMPSRAAWFYLAIAGVLIFFTSASCEVKAQQKPADSDQQLTDFSLSGFGEKGKKNWDLSGKSANILTDTVQLNNIVGNMYGAEENIKLTADKGDFNKSDGKIHLEQNVLIATSSGAKLSTQSLNWDRKNQVVTTKDEVNIERENITAKAQGAKGQPDLSKINLEKNVLVDINQSGVAANAKDAVKNKISITCEGPLEIDYQKNIATFNKKVKVETKDAIIYSDVMEVSFLKSGQNKIGSIDDKSKPMGSQVDKIKAIGNFTIIQGENISQSDEATYSAKDGKITLSGKPKLVIYTPSDANKPFGN